MNAGVSKSLTYSGNARTSVEMIDRFYASHLDGEMNIELIQSRRSIKNQKPTTNEVKAIDEPKPNKTKKPKLRVA